MGKSEGPLALEKASRILLSRPVAVAVTVAALARLVHFLGFRASPLAAAPILDAELYDSWARRIAAGDWLGDQVFYANPLYPYFLGAVYHLLGASAETARLVQHGLGIGTVALVAIIARRFFGAGAALAAGLLAALYGPFLFYEELLLTETLVVFLGAAALASTLAVASARERAGTRASASSRTLSLGSLATGLVLGLGLLARPTLLPVAALGWLARVSWRAALVALLGLVLAVAPVTLRNWLVGGQPVLITAHGGETFYVGNRAGSDGSNRQPEFVRSGPLTEHEDYRREASRRLGREVDLATSSRYWRDQALRFMASDPLAWLGLLAKKAALLLHAYEKGDNEDPAAAGRWIPIQALPLPGYGLVLALAVLGWVAAWRDRALGRPIRFLLLAAIAYVAGCLAIFVTARYRLPLAVALLPMAGHGAATLVGLARRPRSLRMFLLAAGLVGLLLIVLHRPLPPADQSDAAIAAVNLGFLREAEGDLEGAVASYREAIARRPDFPLAHFNLGVAERRRGNLREAESALREAIAIDPDYADAFDQLAMTREQAGDLGSALALYRRAIELDPTRPRYYRDLGRLHVLRGEPDEAIRAWERALALDPGDSVTAGRLANLRRMSDGSR